MKILLFLAFLFLLTVNSFSAVRTWDGGGADTNWLTAANWVGDVAPAANDELVFPAVAAQFSNNNNFPFFTRFNSITVEGGNYTFGGLPITLGGPLSVNSGSLTVNFAMQMAGAQTFTGATGSTVTLLSVSVSVFQLTIDGGGTVGIGLIGGSGPIVKNGAGAAGVLGTLGFTGPITVNGGIFVVDANIPNSTVTVNSPTTSGILGLGGFGGTGTVGATNVIQGGISAGTLNSPTGILNLSNGLTFTANGAYLCKIGGTSPGANGHDQLNVTGAVNLNNSRLGPLPWNGFRPAVGNSFVILRNDGTDPIGGTFLNAPEGSIFAGPLNTAFRISYIGGDGNDVVITRVPRAPFDFDGDGKSDIATYASNTWHVMQSSSGSTSVTQFGLPSDQIAPADFDGDNRSDIAVFRPSNGVWYVLNSASSTVSITQFGADGDMAVPNDFDGDGRADIAVYRPSNGAWYQLRSLSNQFFAQQFGTIGDKPQIADFDGDGIGDLAIFRPSNGYWYFMLSGNNSFFAFPWGIATDIPVPADYDGDGRTDAAVFRPSADPVQADFFILKSVDLAPIYGNWGIPGDLPAVGDYDGDGRADLSVVRPNLNQSLPDNWYLQQTTAGFRAQSFIRSSRPVPGAYVR